MPSYLEVSSAKDIRSDTILSAEFVQTLAHTADHADGTTVEQKIESLRKFAIAFAHTPEQRSLLFAALVAQMYTDLRERVVNGGLYMNPKKSTMEALKKMGDSSFVAASLQKRVGGRKYVSDPQIIYGTMTGYNTISLKDRFNGGRPFNFVAEKPKSRKRIGAREDLREAIKRSRQETLPTEKRSKKVKKSKRSKEGFRDAQSGVQTRSMLARQNVNNLTVNEPITEGYDNVVQEIITHVHPSTSASGTSSGLVSNLGMGSLLSSSSSMIPPVYEEVLE